MTEPQKRDARDDNDARPLKRAQAEDDNEPSGIEPYMERIRTAVGDFDILEYVKKIVKMEDPTVVKLVGEYLRFMTIKLYLAEMCPAVKISPSAVVDNVWHLHILHTAEYRRFCESLGVVFDHCPLDALDEEKHRKQLIICKARYVECFDVLPPSEFWDESGIASGSIAAAVVSMHGKRMHFNVSTAITVADVKSLIRGREGFKQDEQITLIYKGQHMKDDLPLSVYNVSTGDATIYMLLSSSGC